MLAGAWVGMKEKGGKRRGDGGGDKVQAVEGGGYGCDKGDEGDFLDAIVEIFVWFGGF